MPTPYELFTKHDLSDHANSIAHFLPGGKLFEAKNRSQSNLRLFLEGIAQEVSRVETYLIAYNKNYMIEDTPTVYNRNQLLLDEWESAVGIPDSCFPGTGSNSERIQHVLAKLASFGVQTSDDFEFLGAALGLVIYVNAGTGGTVANDLFTMTFPFNLGYDTIDLKFVIEVVYNNADDISFLQCICDVIKPANCAVVFTGLDLMPLVGEAPDPATIDEGTLGPGLLDPFTYQHVTAGVEISWEVEITGNPEDIRFYVENDFAGPPVPFLGTYNFYLFNPAGTLVAQELNQPDNLGGRYIDNTYLHTDFTLPGRWVVVVTGFTTTDAVNSWRAWCQTGDAL